ncbi:LOW QUALITY PROTEIN: auxilin-like protein 1 [Pyrus x bretschneideri]|uniref:LOW QUALITY PROTEIN: auxilin-like protein 1 n=1 Tax=Pyrus x bretschneideri TaxID=225117 RepID=UPI00203091D4|nr:LOW QUALITY PROTEIN: auxilin-like protein 1 [Pyrus x bretschneideri]
MDYQASSVSLSQKLSNGLAIYDGVFSSAAASKFNVSSFSSRVDDYGEIFGGSGASSIPVLDVPELRERKDSVDVRSSKLDYSNVFGGFGDSDFAVPYEELFAEPKKKERRKPAEKRSPSKEADPSDTEGNRVLSHEASYQSFDGAKKFNMSYHKTNHRSKSFTGGAMLHAVPAYTCLVDEVSPIHATEGDKLVPSKENGASPNNNLCERMTEGNHLKAARDLPVVDDRKQTSGAVAKVQNNYDRKRSISHSELFNACEINPSSSPSISSPLSEGKVEFEKPMASIFGVSRSDNLEGSGPVSSPPYFDEEVDTNSTAAASAAALIKAIEEAQARINMAKESKERRKTGSQNRVKPSFNNGAKFEVKGDKFVDTVSIPKERKTGGLHEEGAVPVHVYTSTKLEVRGDKFADKVSIPQERKARELHEEVAIFVHDSTGMKLEAKEDKFADKVSMPKERKSRELHEEVTVPVHHSTSTKLEVKGDKYADKVSIPKERETPGLHEEVAVPVRVSKSTKLEVKGDKFADGVGLPEERKTQELREEVAVPVHFSIFSNGLEQVTAALDDANKNFGAKETGGKIENESISTHMGCTQQQADVLEAAEQFYEVADTGEPDFSEAAEQFYEFPDTGELDLSEPAEVFYEFSDSSEHQATTVEDEEANPAIKMIQIAVEEEQKRKKTTTEAFENPELCGERLQAAKYDEQGELEKIFSLDAGSSKCEEHASELETVKDAFDQEENENRLEASRVHEETGKLQASYLKEILEEKPGELEKLKGYNRRHETQELQETRHVKQKLMSQEWVDYEKIGDEAYKQEEDEREQKHVHRGEDTERWFNKDNRQNIIEETLKDSNDEEYVEKRNESKSEGHEKLDDLREPEMIPEGAASQEIECEKRQQESFPCVVDGRMEVLIDQSTEDEKVTEAREDLKNPDCNYEATNNLCEEGDSEDLNEKEGPTGHAEYAQDVEETLDVPAHEEDGDRIEVAETLDELEENVDHSESVEEDNGTVEKEMCETDCNFKATNNLCEEGDSEDLNEKEWSTGHAEYDKDVEETLDVPAHEEDWDRIEVAETLDELKENVDQSESVEEDNGTVEKEMHETDCNFEATNNLCEESDSEDLNKKEGSTGHAEYDKDVEETLEVPAHEENGDRIEVAETLDELKENVNQSESVEEDNGTVEKEMHETDCNFEATNNLCEEGDGEDLDEKEGPTGHAEYDKDVEEALKVPAHEEDGDRIEVAETLDELKENVNQSESVEEDNGTVEKEMHETDCKLAELPKQVQDATEVHSCDENGITLKRNDMSSGQKQDHQLVRETEVVNDFRKQVEELGDINKYMMEAEVSAKQEENRNNSRSSHRKRWFDKLDVSETLIKLKENGNQSESVEEGNGMEEKEICEADGLASGVKLAEILKQMEDPIESHPCEENGINVDINAMNCGQKQDVTLEKHVEEMQEINEDVKEIEVAVDQEENKNNSKPSHRKRWFDDGTSTEVAQLSHILRRKGRNVRLDHETETTCAEENMDNHKATTTEECVIIHSSLQVLEQEKGENRQTTLTAKKSEKRHTSKKEVEQQKMENQQETPTAEECETSARLQKEVEIEKELLKQKQNAKGRERERVKEKKAVERVIREARERAFAEARERAAETRQKAIAEAQERSGKTSVKANDISLAEKASKEAKLKSERAAVERATEEARERALEKALSGKAYEAGKQAKRSVSEKSSGASRDDGMKLGVSPSDPESKSRYPSSSNNSDPSPAERSGGSNVESSQRCKAKLERNQRTAERAAKALAEKNMRDLLVQKEQAERNRLAEGLDAEVKRWSSGKERNLRALLSTLQYILGPDSGWQPIPLTEIITTVAVKKAYRKAALFVHPDKLQQRGASIQQKYTCEKVFDLLQEAWNRFNVEER